MLLVVLAGLASMAAAATASGPPSGSDVADASRAAGDLDRALARSVNRNRVAGATAAVVANGKTVSTGAAGRAGGGRGGMRADSRFPIASTISPTERSTGRSARTPATRGRVPRSSTTSIGSSFTPGSRNGYSNSGYVALGGVIEHASGGTVDGAFQRLIAKLLGLEDSTFRYGDAPQRGFAHPLKAQRGRGFRDRFGRRGRIPTDYWGDLWTDGGLASTSADLARIGNALYAGDLLAPKSVAQMLPARRGGYGLGTFDLQAEGRTWIGHDGSYGGYQTEYWTDRERGITVVVMTNAAGGGAVSPRLWKAVAGHYTG